MTAAASTLKTGVVKEIIFNVIAIVEMIADNVSVFLHNKVTTVCIITTFPLFSRCHT